MFQSLTDRLSGVLDKLTRRGALTENDVSEAMREVRRALLEADVALDVVRDFTDKVKAKAVGQNVVKSVSPGQMVIKIVNDELVAMLTEKAKMKPQPEVHIRGDQGARYESIGRVVFACQRAGIAKVGFITEPPPNH